jgi:hypothetical protein
VTLKLTPNTQSRPQDGTYSYKFLRLAQVLALAEGNRGEHASECKPCSEEALTIGVDVYAACDPGVERDRYGYGPEQGRGEFPHVIHRSESNPRRTRCANRPAGAGMGSVTQWGLTLSTDSSPYCTGATTGVQKATSRHIFNEQRKTPGGGSPSGGLWRSEAVACKATESLHKFDRTSRA